MQQVEVEMVRAEAREACIASAGDAIAGHFVGLDFGDQENTVALIGDDMTQELLRAAIAVIS